MPRSWKSFKIMSKWIRWRKCFDLYC